MKSCHGKKRTKHQTYWISPSSSSPVAPVDHVRLDRPSSPRWAPLHTRTRPASRYLNIQCARSSLALIHFTSPRVQHPPTLLLPFSPLQFYLPLSRSQALPFLCSCPPITIGKKYQSWKTLVRYFSQASNTHNLFFFSVTIPHKPPSNNPPLCSSSVIKLSSTVIFFPVFIPVNWALWWTVNKLVNHTNNPLYISDKTTNTLCRVSAGLLNTIPLPRILFLITYFCELNDPAWIFVGSQ